MMVRQFNCKEYLLRCEQGINATKMSNIINFGFTPYDDDIIVETYNNYLV